MKSSSVLLLLLVVALVFARHIPAGLAGDNNRPPTLLFLLADDLGAGDLGCYGAPDLETPHLDQLVAEGMRFTQFYANAAVCSPTRLAFLTGRYHQHTDLENALYYQEMGRGLPADGATLADALSAAGYVTGLSGKWHLGYDLERQPLQQGFDHFFGLLGGNHHYFEHMDRIGVPDLWLGNEPVEREGYTTDLLTEDALAFLDRNRDEPFFLFLSHAAPHFPYQGPDDREKKVRPRTKAWQEGDRETYIAMVERMDHGIGRVLDRLETLGLGQRTLVVFTSDNGGSTHARNEPFRGRKSTIWEGGVRVPCIARWPGVLPAGVTVDQVAITMDWTATFRRVAGIEPDPNGEDGIDLLPILRGKSAERERTLFWRRRKGPKRRSVVEGRAVREGPWKLIEQASGERFLFDLEIDPGERTNLLALHPGRGHHLHRLLDEWEASLGPPPELR